MTTTNESTISVKEIEQKIESSVSTVDAHKAYVEARKKIEDARKQIALEIQDAGKSLKGLFEQKVVWDQLLAEITSLAKNHHLKQIGYDELKQLVAGYLLPYLIDTNAISGSQSDNFFSTVFPEKITEMTEVSYTLLGRLPQKISVVITDIQNRINELDSKMSQMRQRLVALRQVAEKIHNVCEQRFGDTFHTLDEQYVMIHDVLPRTESFQLPPMSNDPNNFIELSYVVPDSKTQGQVAAALHNTGLTDEEFTYLQEALYSDPRLDVGEMGIRHAQETNGSFPDYVISFTDTPEDVRQLGERVIRYRIPQTTVFDWRSWANEYIGSLEIKIEEESNWSKDPNELSRLKEEKAKCEAGCRKQRYLVLGHLRPEWEIKEE